MKLSKMFLTKKFFTLAMLLFFSIVAFSQTATVDLSTHEPLTAAPVGSVFEWHSTATPSSTDLLIGTAITAATTSTNYGVYYDATSDCYSPAAKVDVVITACGIATLDLTIYAPLGARWYTSSAHDTEVLAPTMLATSGTYFPFDVVGTTYTPINEVVIVLFNPLPIATITAATSTTFCAGGSVVLTANASTSYLWSTNETTQSITVSTTSSPTVQVTDANGCQSVASAATVVTVSTLSAAPVLTATSVTNTCPSLTVDLTSLTSSAPTGFSIVWYSNNAIPPTGTAVADPTKAATGTGLIYYAFFKDNASTCLNSSYASNGVKADPSGDCCPAGYVAPIIH